MSMLRYNEPELHRIVNELNAVADSWQMEWEQAKHIVFGNTQISPWAASREAEHRFDERISLVLIDAYLNGGFRADPRWRNLIAMRKKAKANETHFYWQRMGWGIFETILYKLSFHNRCKLLISDRIRALRYVASRVTLTPKDHIDHRTENKYRRNRYRLPKAQRTTLSTYIQMQQFNPRGDYSSMEEALKEPWRVRLLTLETSETQLPDEIMKFTYLTYLKLSGKNLLALPENLGELRWLEVLYLNCPMLSTLPESIGQLAHLVTLVADKAQFAMMPDSVGDIIQLRQLRLYENKLRHLPDSIGRLIHLAELNLGNNALETLPDNISGCTALVSLTLDRNHLANLPESIGALLNLKFLGIAINKLTTVPETIGNLKSLQTLNLSFNKLKTLPESIGKLQELHDLLLANNVLRSLPESVSAIPHLNLLNLHANHHLQLLPDHIRCDHLIISECYSLRTLPTFSDLRWTEMTLEVAESGLVEIPDELVSKVRLRWRGVRVTPRIVCRPETLTGYEALNEWDVEVRRIMIMRIGYERFLHEVNAEMLDEDSDAGGRRRLLRVSLDDDEPLVCLDVLDPSTKRQYLLRVPPTISSCRRAAAWIAGFDNPDEYHPIVET